MSGRRIGIGLLIVALLVLAPGCMGTGRLSPAAKNQLHGAADTAEARSRSFKLWAPKVKAKNAAEESALQGILKAHDEGLVSQANALRDLSEAIRKK